MDSHSGKQLHIWIDGSKYDMCTELVSSGVYKSLSELVRDGIDMVIEKASGYEDMRREEIASRFGPDDLIETRIMIDGTMMRMRVYARWWHLYAKTKLQDLIKDLHIPQALSDIEEKYGTKIQLFNMHETIPDIE